MYLVFHDFKQNRSLQDITFSMDYTYGTAKVDQQRSFRWNRGCPPEEKFFVLVA